VARVCCQSGREPTLSAPGKTRREALALLGGAGALALLGRRADAMGERTRFTIGQLSYAGGNWNPRPNGLRRLLWEIDKRTSIDTRAEPAVLRLDDKALFASPMLWLAGDRAFPLPGEADLARLRRHLGLGGFMVIDSAEAREGGGFDKSARELMAALLPRRPLTRLPESHVLYKSFYLVPTPVGRVLVQPYLEAAFEDEGGGRALVVYSQNDLGGAWARDNFGRWEHEVYPGGEPQREHSFRVGINLVMYALCQDYKADQVHVPFLLKRRKWRPDSP